MIGNIEILKYSENGSTVNETRKCVKCGGVFELHLFKKSKNSIGGRASICKKCVSNNAKKHYQEHRDEKLEYARRWQNENPKYLINWKKENPEYLKKWKEDNPNYIRERYIKNKEKFIERTRKWREENYDRLMEIADKSRATKEGGWVGPPPKGYRNILIKNQNNLCYYCGCDLLESGTNLEHKTPLSKGGKHSMDNMVISCPRCNRRKCSKTEEEYKEYCSK